MRLAEVVADHATRLKAVKEAGDLLGLNVSKVLLGQQGQGPVQVTVFPVGA